MRTHQLHLRRYRMRLDVLLAKIASAQVKRCSAEREDITGSDSECHVS